jgi:hypothetical protein
MWLPDSDIFFARVLVVWLGNAGVTVRFRANG